jgi:hypothetical protein
LKLSRHQRKQLIQLLSLLLLLQGLFPMQLHTQLVRNDRGQLVEVCTIDGIRTVTVDFEQPSSHTGDPERTAAMALSDLMSEATFELPDIHYPEADPVTGIMPLFSGVIHSLPHHGLRPIRAPPLPVV